MDTPKWSRRDTSFNIGARGSAPKKNIDNKKSFNIIVIKTQIKFLCTNIGSTKNVFRFICILF